VKRRVRDAGVAGSNPATPTMKSLENFQLGLLTPNGFAMNGLRAV
jgi:hypothetical protein